MKRNFTRLAFICLFTLSGLTSYGQAPQKIILEVATGTWAGWATQGHVVANEVVQNHENVLACNLHNGDSFATTDGNTILNTYVTGYPTGAINRKNTDNQIFRSRTLWESSVQSEPATSPLGVALSGVSVDADTRKLSVTVTAKAFAAVESGSWRMNVFVLEDKLVAAQENYDPNLGDPVITEYEHNNVVRAMLGGPWGTPDLFPAMLAIDQEVSHNYEYTIPAEHVLENIKVVALVQNYDEADVSNRAIINVEWIESLPQAPAFDMACSAIAVPVDGSNQGPFSNMNAGISDNEASITPAATDCTSSWCAEETNAGIQNSVWFSFVAPSSENVSVSTCGMADFDTQIAVYEATDCGDFGTYTLKGANDDGPETCATDYDSYVEVNVLTAGETYYVLVDGFDAAEGSFEIAITELMASSVSTLSEAKVNVFPNPTSEFLTLEAESTYDRVQIYSLTGQLLFDRAMSIQQGESVTLDLPAMPNGAYLGVLSNGREKANFKFIVEK